MVHSRQLANPPMNACDTILLANTDGGLLVLLLGVEGNQTILLCFNQCFVMYNIVSDSLSLL